MNTSKPLPSGNYLPMRGCYSHDAAWWRDGHDPRNLDGFRDAPIHCPYCERIMSKREAAEQGACNDCAVNA